MFERFSDAALIDAMGEATRDESAMIAQRLAATCCRQIGWDKGAWDKGAWDQAGTALAFARSALGKSTLPSAAAIVTRLRPPDLAR